MDNFDDWIKAYKPVLDTGRDLREGQALLGQAIIEAMRNKTNVIGQAPVGVGKSHALLVPMISQILEAKAKGEERKRGIISTETLSLQSQVAFKDLPELQQLFPGFTFSILKGRSNYYCADAAKQNRIANKEIAAIYDKLEMRMESIDTGEKYDIERVLGRELTSKEFSFIAGSSIFCNDNKCEPDRCFTAKARQKALMSDIVVINHALLQTDIDMKTGTNDMLSDGLLGPIAYLAIDEAHTLAHSLISGWSEKMTEWDIADAFNGISKGVEKARAITPDARIGKLVHDAQEDLHDVMNTIIRFYGYIADKNNVEWNKSSEAISQKTIVGDMSPGFSQAMDEYENEVPALMIRADKNLKEVEEFLKRQVVIANQSDMPVKGKREMRKGLRQLREMTQLLDTLTKAMETRHGIAFNYGINYGVRFDGWNRRDGQRTGTIHFVPLDISSKAKQIWDQTESSILVSGTLVDLETGSFNYVKSSLGFPECTTLTVDSPFDTSQAQLIYVTSNEYKPEEGTQFSLDELADLLTASRGRALVLFTSKRELELATQDVKFRLMMGKIPYFNLLVQDGETDKQKLADAFRQDTHSVLFGLRSFFTGVDFPGETLSLVAIVRFPFKRYSVECRQMIEVWKNKGFYNWYQHQALEDFGQIVGRLLRSVTDKGVFAILDHRLLHPSENAYKAAAIGITALQSKVTQKIEDVEAFLS